MGFDFSAVATGYATYRPRYPAALVDILADHAPGHALAWETGCGSGQLTVELATRFDRVIATDASTAQLAQASPRPNIEYRHAGGEDGIAETGCDLCVVAQAAHWFDWPRYVAAVDRAARPGGLVAAIAYGNATIAGAAGPELAHFMDGVLGTYWPAERVHIDNGYRDLVWPWPAIETAPIELVEHWTRDQLLGYVWTWSATTRHVAACGPAEVEAFARRLAADWPDDERRDVRWPLVLKLARR